MLAAHTILLLPQVPLSRVPGVLLAGPARLLAPLLALDLPALLSALDTRFKFTRETRDRTNECIRRGSGSKQLDDDI